MFLLLFFFTHPVLESRDISTINISRSRSPIILSSSEARVMNSNNYHSFEIQVAKVTNGPKNGSAEENTSIT